MDPTPSPAPQKKKEGWLGVGFTAVLCGIFLFWWYQPTRVDTTTERDPTYWVGLARQELGTTEPPLSLRLEIILITEALRAHRQEIVADALETDWLPPAWLSSPTETRPDAPPPPCPPRSPPLSKKPPPRSTPSTSNTDNSSSAPPPPPPPACPPSRARPHSGWSPPGKRATAFPPKPARLDNNSTPSQPRRSFHPGF